jgi:hypothetical protein
MEELAGDLGHEEHAAHGCVEQVQGRLPQVDLGTGHALGGHGGGLREG